VLAVSARVLGVDRKQVHALLDRVGLPPEAAKRRVGAYSLGMRQRLGLAHALLGDPAVLILDEPANGLDPEGIFWMRGLLREFGDRGGTVLLSSHLLREVEVIADHLVVIGRGRIVAQGSKADLLNAAGVRVRSTDPGALRAALDAAGLRASGAHDGGFAVDADAEAVGRAAAAAGVVLTELRPADGSGLEEMFLQLTAAQHEEVAA
jgi:ABC-2 type transport system ATP-binding protein